MICNSEQLTLFHSSYAVIEKPDLAYCRKRNDFGRGFYLTTDRKQAERFVKTAVKKSGKESRSGFVNEYRMENFKDLNCLEFHSTDKDWLDCVCSHRRFEINPKSIKKWEPFDAVIGKIANDDTMTTILIYLSGGYGLYGSEEAVETAIRVLKPERLSNQICLRTEKAVSRLCFIAAHEVALK